MSTGLYVRIIRISQQTKSESVAGYARSEGEVMDHMRRISQQGDSCRIQELEVPAGSTPTKDLQALFGAPTIIISQRTEPTCGRQDCDADENPEHWVDTEISAEFASFVQRLIDLARHYRAEAHQDGLISDAEFAWLAEQIGGFKRLEAYDEMRERLDRIASLTDILGKPVLQYLQEQFPQFAKASKGHRPLIDWYDALLSCAGK